MQELLLQFSNRRVELIILAKTIKNEKKRKGKVGNQITGIRTISLEGKKEESTSLLANFIRKQII